MASDYGLNFGFRRSDENNATREGRLKTPVGSAFLIGTAVEIDPASAGYLKQSAANAAPVTGKSGLLVQEESHMFGLFDVQDHDSIDLGTAKADKYSIVWSGPGTKVWMRNTAAYSKGGRTKAAVNIVDTTSVAVGDRLGWNGTKWVKSDGSTTPHWLTVTAVSTGYVEAVITF
ncbi:hypothetical protein GCM10028801_30840 [Nocardioides maradonensis]